MTRGKRILFAWLLAACSPPTDDSAKATLAPPPREPSTAVATDPPACSSEAAQLRDYLAALEREGTIVPDVFPVSDDRYEDRPLPAIPLARVEVPPLPGPHGALLILDGGQLRFGNDTANAADAAAATALFERAADSGLSGGFGSGSSRSESFIQYFRFVVGAAEPWRDVVGAIDAAIKARFTLVSFLVEAKSEIEPGPAFPARTQMQDAASQRGEMPWKRDVALHAAFREATAACPGLSAPFFPRARDSAVAERQLALFFIGAADAYRACGCNVERRVVEAFGWVAMGRHWGRPTVGIEIDLGTMSGPRMPPPTPFKASAGARFDEVVPRLREIPKGAAVKLSVQ